MKTPTFTIALLLSLILIGYDRISNINYTDNERKKHIGISMFQHHYVARELPGDERFGYGISLLADIDNDGDLDYVTCVKQDSIYWFENKGNGEWQRHTVGNITTTQLGSAVMDIDEDGWLDIIIGGMWYQNPQNPRNKLFKNFVYDDRIVSEIHDIVNADINGNGKSDIVVLGDKEGCFWYEISNQPLRETNWTRHVITMDVLIENDRIHSGFWPAGIGDLNGDGNVDIVLPGRWLENRNQGKEWVRHSLPFGKSGKYGFSARSWIVDLNNDGFPDIVMVDSDQEGSGAAWLEHDGQQPPSFKAHHLKKEAKGERGSFHSLIVADFDGDGDLDIFTAEQEDPNIFPSGAGPRGYIWENLGTEEVSFKERVIFDNNLGIHDAMVGDIDGDGDLDIISKIWNRWPENANGGKEHVDWLENLSISSDVKKF